MRFSTFSLLRRGVWRRSAFLLLGVSTLTVATALAQEVREWRSAAGRPIKTSTNEKLVGTLRLDGDDEPGKVRIKMGGKTFRFTLSNLSEADRKYVAEQRAAQNGSQPAPAPKPEPAKPTPQPKPEPAQPTRTIVSNPAPALAEDASRALVAIPKDGVKRALLVGVDDYAEFADLKYAVADVEAIRERLIGLGFKPENIVELKSTNPANLRPSQRYIRRQVDALLKAAGPNDLLFLHFSGHGFQTDGVVRFAPEDAVATGDENVLDPETTISLTEIIERLKTSEAKFKWLIVDACRENPTGTRSAAANARALKNIDPNKGVLVLQSCAEGELSFEDADAGRGLFTGRLLEAFDGKADFDGDGAISALDVCKYVSEQTLAASKTRFNATQTPYFSGEFSDFIVAEDLKIDGLTREDWEQAETLYDAALKLTETEDYETAQEKIDAALEIVADVPDANPEKKRYVDRKTIIERLLKLQTAATSASATGTGTSTASSATTSTVAPRNFDRVVSTASELVSAIENASDGDAIALEDGTYRLSEEITLENKALTLVGKSGNRERVKITISGQGSHVFDVNAGVKLTLEDLSLEAKEWSAICSLGTSGDSTVNATRCNITTLGGQNSISGSARHILKECDVVGGMNNDGYRRAAEVSQGGSITAEDCNFTGRVYINFESQPSSLKNCAIRDSGQFSCVEVNDSSNSSTSCELIDCQLENANRGLRAYDHGQITMRGGVIRHMRKNDISRAADVSDDAVLTLDGVEIFDCSIGVWVSYGGKCNATNLTFTNVDDEWRISDDAGTVTHNGRRITDDD